MNDNYNYRDYRTSSESGCGNFKNAARTPSSRNFSAFSWIGTLMLLLFTQLGMAQASSYTFAQSSGTYTAITGGSVVTTSTSGSPNLDSYVSTNITIPSFTFAGTAYTKMYVTGNGTIALGFSTPSSSTYTVLSTATGGNVFLAPLSADLDDNTGVSEIRYETIGNEFIVQWKNFRRYNVGESINFQVRMNTSTGVIKFVYDGVPPYGTSTSYQPQVGIKSAAGNYSALTVGTSGSWNTPTNITTGIVAGSVATFSGSVGPTSGLTYTWTPLVLSPCTTPSAAATALVFGTTTTTAIAGSFTAASPAPSKYLIVRSTSATAPTPSNGTVYSVGDVTLGAGTNVRSASTATTFSDTGLTAGTQYYYYIFSYNDLCTGEPFYMTTPLSGTQSTVCATGTVLGSNTVTTTSANITWTGSGNYVVEYGVTGFTPGTGATAGTGGTIASSSATSPYALSGLSGSTTYQVYVRQICALGGYSANSSATSLTTACAAITTFPSTEPFATYLPNCWREGDAGDLTAGPSSFGASVSDWTVDGFLNVGGTGAAKMNIDTASGSEWIISPFYTIPASGYRVKYSVGATNYGATTAVTNWEADDFVELLVSTSNANWTVLKTYNSANVPSNLGQIDNVDLSTYSGQTVQFAFRAFEGAADGPADIDFFIDNFIVELTPSCLQPIATGTNTFAATTATINWTAPSSAPSTGYNYEVRTSGTGGSGATGLFVSGSTAAGVVTANITGLTPTTTYSVFVQSNCGGSGTSLWTSLGTYTTTQIAATLPYTQNFSGANSFSFVNGTQVNQWVNGSAAGNPGNSIYISNDAGITNAYTLSTTSVTQAYRDIAIANGTTTASFSFDWKANGEATYDYLRVWLVPTSFVPVAGTQITAGAGRIQVGANFNQQATWQTYTNASLDLSTFANSAMRLVFEWRNDGSGGTQTPAAVDNISLSIPTCIAPTALVSSAVTATTATLSWTASSSNPTNGYDIYYSTTNTAPLAGTTPTVDNNASATYNATGLSASSTYYWWVRSDCGSETTLWISGGSFTTPCAPEATPTVVQNFDAFTSTTPPTCWSEATGALTASSTLTGTTSSWLLKTNGFANASSTNNGASINLYGTNNNWLISQQIDLGPTAGVKRLNFDYAVTSYNGTIAQTTLGTHQVRVVVSTDGGSTWSLANVIKTFTGVASYSNTGASEQIILNYSGVVKIGFLATTSSTTPDIDFHIDNVGVDTAPTDTPDYVNLQFPASATILAGGSATVYARVYEGGLTDATSGQAPGITAWIGISPEGADASSNPNTWTTWVPATFNAETDGGSNDEYQANIGAALAVGTYRYASRFQLNGGPFVYGGNPFNAWNGTTSNSGVLTVNANPTQCATLVSPANAATNLTKGTVTLSWTAPANGPAPTGYKVYFGTTAGTTTLVTTTGAAVLTYNASTPAFNTTYYWRVVPTSVIGGGDATGCTEFSFTTESDPFAPYCGGLEFTSNVEPITSVVFAGINNASSAVKDGTPDHENFISISGNVTTENSYTMTLKGNTDGASFTNNFRVFIDWNQDGDFADAGETFNAGSITGSTGSDAIVAVSTITVPSGALAGATRMRVKKLFGTTSLENPCIAGGYGQVEDYTLNVTVCTAITYYADTDGDGFGDPNDSISTCGAAPVGYITDNSDCFPTDVTYLDFDNDGFGSTTIAPCGVTNNTDCDDTNANKRGLFSFYLDADADNFGTGALLDGICALNAATAPTGYSVNNLDCNDGNSNINPGASEVLYNRIDENCNGLLDEGFEVKTKIQPSQCGATVAAIYTSIKATAISGATGYTFHVRKLPVNPAFTPITDPAAQHVVTTNQYFAMRDVPGVEYGTDYEVSVEVRMSGNSVFVGYVGEPCRIGTPPVLAPNVAGGSTQCGTTLPNFYSTVGTTPVASAVAYKFFIKDIAPAGTGGLPVNYVGESIERSTAWFTLSMFQNVGYGRTYELQVAVKTSANGAFSPYSPVCVITTPPAQPLVNCEASIPAKYTNIATTNLSRVTQYEFELTNIGSAEPDPITTSTVLTSKNYFNFNQLPAANYYAGIEYGVRVRVYVNNIVSEWTDPCVIISPAAAGRQSQDNVLAGQGFNALALPNPFANSFAISVSTSSIEAVSYKVYDMTGRLLEARTAAVSDMASQEIGDRYPAGVYNVIVSQGTEIKTLRVIKR